MATAQAIDRGTNQLGTSRSRNQPVKRHSLAVAFAAAGAISFWVPDVLIHADAGPNLDARHGWGITVLAPAIFLVTYLVARRFGSKHQFNRVGPAMLLGVWLAGGLFMTLAAILSRSEFLGGTGIWRLVVIVISVIPVITFILAAYDGSLFALLVITVGGLVVCGARSALLLWASNSGEPSTTALESPRPRAHSKVA
jgi:hypothetical protein